MIFFIRKSVALCVFKNGKLIFEDLYHLKFFKCPLRALIPYTCLQVLSFAAPSRSKTTNSNGCSKFYSVYYFRKEKVDPPETMPPQA
jgi:hypothetical protein